MKNQFKPGDTIRVKSKIKSSNDIPDKYWKGIGQVSISDILNKELIVQHTYEYEYEYDQGVVLKDIKYSYTYPSELFELVTTDYFNDDIVPGDYIFIGRAGGWGYYHDDDYNIAIVDSIKTLKNIDEPILGRGFTGRLLKNNLRFVNIPEFDRSGKEIVRKATPEDFTRYGTSIPSYLVATSQKKKDTSVRKIDSDPIPRNKKHRTVEIISTKNLTL